MLTVRGTSSGVVLPYPGKGKDTKDTCVDYNDFAGGVADVRPRVVVKSDMALALIDVAESILLIPETLLLTGGHTMPCTRDISALS